VGHGDICNWRSVAIVHDSARRRADSSSSYRKSFSRSFSSNRNGMNGAKNGSLAKITRHASDSSVSPLGTFVPITASVSSRGSGVPGVTTITVNVPELDSPAAKVVESARVGAGPFVVTESLPKGCGATYGYHIGNETAPVKLICRKVSLFSQKLPASCTSPNERGL